MPTAAELAAQLGIEARYVDAWGKPCHVDDETLTRLTAAVAGEETSDRRTEAGGRTAIAGMHAFEPAYFREGGRLWLLAAQLYGVRSRRNWGHGDFTDLADLVRIAGRAGAAAVGVNPLHALFSDQPERVSPYSPSSRLFLNPLYIDLDAVPEFPGTRALGIAPEIERLRATDLVDYTAVSAIKQRALRAAFEVFRPVKGERRESFEAFRAERGKDLARFAAFETMRARFGRNWTEWPKQWRGPADAASVELGRTDAVEMEFHVYVQWLADGQLAACRDLAIEIGLPIGLYLDIAVGVAPDGADAWIERQAFVLGASLGAPPDVYNRGGQNWGLAAFNPIALAAADFTPFRHTLRTAMRHAGAVRIDHVLGLNRVYLVPDGLPATRGAYLRYPFNAMLEAVAQESERAECLVIGEDLGTVPEGLREKLAQTGIFSYRVMLFERASDGSFIAPADYPAHALVTFDTHDMCTFTGWLTHRDLEVKRSLGLDPGESDEEREAAQKILRNALAGAALPHRPEFAHVARYLARTPSRLLSVSLEDALGVADQPNIPGTVDEYPNWRRRLPLALEDFERSEEFQKLAAALRDEGRGYNRQV